MEDTTTMMNSAFSSKIETDVEGFQPVLQTGPWGANRSQFSSAKSARSLRYAGVLTLFAGVSAWLAYHATGGVSSAFSTSMSAHDTSLQAITNSTLGFQKIYSISLPNHWHKHDAQLLAARYLGFEIENVQGIMWDDIPKTEYPVGWHDPYYASIGCWRAHLNVLTKIVEDGVASALILEDDADFDVSLKPQLQEFARGAMSLQNTKGMQPHGSPYGDSWDMLWLGSFHWNQPEFDHKYYLIENDPTVPPLNHRYARWAGTEALLDLNNTRAVFRAGYGVGLTGYAVTQDAARRMLATVSLPPNVVESAIDRKYGRMCGHYDNELALNCIGVYPPLIAMHRFAGSTKADSDIVDNSKEDHVHPEYAYDLVYSTTMNLPALAMGATTVKAQWPKDVAEPEIPVGKKWAWTNSLRFIDPAED